MRPPPSPAILIAHRRETILSRIQGFANAAATDAHAGRYEAVQHAVLGRTGLACSQAGFGCYRVAEGVETHRAALQKALAAGINLIDTSTNYADGASETLVGKVLAEGIRSGGLQREEVVVVSKVGYLQGRNYALSQDRKARGRPFPDLVPYADGLEHCIHPEFIRDQLARSLQRLNLAALDVYLLHNPEYYLSWASAQGTPMTTARAEYDRRLLAAFRCLEDEADRGHIRYYGISSNTFPVSDQREDYTCLEHVLELAASLGAGNRLAVIQFPMNLVESDAILTVNQPSGATLLEAARRADLGTLVNRPLNAIGPAGLLRLADVSKPRRPTVGEIGQVLQALEASEASLAEDILPNLAVPAEVRTRIQEHVRVAPALRPHYREFPSYEAWCQIRDTHLLPRVKGVLDYFERQVPPEPLRQWTDHHRRMVAQAFQAVTALYAGPAADRARAIREIVQEADPDWRGNASLSQLAIRTLRTTEGISSVLVGMRRPPYVHAVLDELRRPLTPRPRRRAWGRIRAQLEGRHIIGLPE